MFRQDFSCPALLKDTKPSYPYGAITHYGLPFQTVLVRRLSTTGLVRVRSTTNGVSVDVLSSRY